MGMQLIEFLQVDDRQLTVDAFYPGLAKEINEDVINNALRHYCKDFPYLKLEEVIGYQDYFCSKHLPLKDFIPGTVRILVGMMLLRWVAWMVYLNDVEEGGETEFLYQSLRIKPKKGMAVIWPGTYTHLHRGNPPLKGDKYILTGWFTLTCGMNTFVMNVDQ